MGSAVAAPSSTREIRNSLRWSHGLLRGRCCALLAAMFVCCALSLVVVALSLEVTGFSTSVDDGSQNSSGIARLVYEHKSWGLSFPVLISVSCAMGALLTLTAAVCLSRCKRSLSWEHNRLAPPTHVPPNNDTVANFTARPIVGKSPVEAAHQAVQDWRQWSEDEKPAAVKLQHLASTGQRSMYRACGKCRHNCLIIWCRDDMQFTRRQSLRPPTLQDNTGCAREGLLCIGILQLCGASILLASLYNWQWNSLCSNEINLFAPNWQCRSTEPDILLAYRTGSGTGNLSVVESAPMWAAKWARLNIDVVIMIIFKQFVVHCLVCLRYPLWGILPVVLSILMLVTKMVVRVLISTNSEEHSDSTSQASADTSSLAAQLSTIIVIVMLGSVLELGLIYMLYNGRALLKWSKRAVAVADWRPGCSGWSLGDLSFRKGEVVAVHTDDLDGKQYLHWIRAHIENDGSRNGIAPRTYLELLPPPPREFDACARLAQKSLASLAQLAGAAWLDQQNAKLREAVETTANITGTPLNDEQWAAVALHVGRQCIECKARWIEMHRDLTLCTSDKHADISSQTQLREAQHINRDSIATLKTSADNCDDPTITADKAFVEQACQIFAESERPKSTERRRPKSAGVPPTQTLKIRHAEVGSIRSDMEATQHACRHILGQIQQQVFDNGENNNVEVFDFQQSETQSAVLIEATKYPFSSPEINRKLKALPGAVQYSSDLLAHSATTCADHTSNCYRIMDTSHTALLGGRPQSAGARLSSAGVVAYSVSNYFKNPVDSEKTTLSSQNSVRHHLSAHFDRQDNVFGDPHLRTSEQLFRNVQESQTYSARRLDAASAVEAIKMFEKVDRPLVQIWEEDHHSFLSDIPGHRRLRRFDMRLRPRSASARLQFNSNRDNQRFTETIVQKDQDCTAFSPNHDYSIDDPSNLDIPPREVWDMVRGGGASVERAASNTEVLERDQGVCRFAVYAAQHDRRWPAQDASVNGATSTSGEIRADLCNGATEFGMCAGDEHSIKTKYGVPSLGYYLVERDSARQDAATEHVHADGAIGAAPAPTLAAVVAEWLSSAGLGQYIVQLSKIGTSFEDFASLRAADLLSVGITCPEDQAAILTRMRVKPPPSTEEPARPRVSGCNVRRAGKRMQL